MLNVTENLSDDETYLDLSDNDLTSLPTAIGNLKQLEHLSLVGTDLSETELEKIKVNLPNTIIYY